MTWLSERKLSKRKACDDYYPKLYLGQFDFHFNVSSSLTSIDSQISSTYALRSSSPTHSIYAISICIIYLSRYKIIILLCEVVSFVIGIGQGIG